jgi:acyl carrier protein
LFGTKAVQKTLMPSGASLMPDQTGDHNLMHRISDIGLTSVDTVNLMLAIETAFDLMILDGEITPEDFRSIATIETLIVKIDPRLVRPVTPA